jgi:hypothetical protein
MSGRTTPPPGHDGGAARPAVTVCRGCCCPPKAGESGRHSTTDQPLHRRGVLCGGLGGLPGICLPCMRCGETSGARSTELMDSPMEKIALRLGCTPVDRAAVPT